MFELVKEIWSTSKRNKLRTSLTGFAVAWGIFMLIFLLGAGNGLINAQLKESDRFLANSMVVFGGQTTKAYNGLKEGRTVELNDRDMFISAHTFAGHVDNVSGRLQTIGTITYGDNYMASQTFSGVYPSAAKINKTEMLCGRFVNDLDMQQQRKVIIVSGKHARELIGKDYARLLGQHVKVDNIVFRVVGVYKDDESSESQPLYTAFTTMKTIYGKGDKAGDIMFTLKDLATKEQNEEFETNYRAVINKNHQAAPDDAGALWLWNRYMGNIQMNQGIAIIQTALWIVGLFTLLSGIVGVSNIMLITVKERTREFGVRKAIGAKPWNILKLIITESVVITGVFGYIGMVLGIIGNEVLDATLGHAQVDMGFAKATIFVNPTVGLDVCIEATLAIIVAGTIAGLIPAIKASRIRPIEALRAE